MTHEFNSPPEGLKEIHIREWCDLLFHYQSSEKQLRQVRTDDDIYDLIMFPIPNFKNKELGIAVMKDWFNFGTGQPRQINIVRLCRYGSDADWEEFQRLFAAQFAGDNS